MLILDLAKAIFDAVFDEAEKRKMDVDQKRTGLGNRTNRELYGGASNSNNDLNTRMANALELKDRVNK